MSSVLGESFLSVKIGKLRDLSFYGLAGIHNLTYYSNECLIWRGLEILLELLGHFLGGSVYNLGLLIC